MSEKYYMSSIQKRLYAAFISLIQRQMRSMYQLENLLLIHSCTYWILKGTSYHLV